MWGIGICSAAILRAAGLPALHDARAAAAAPAPWAQGLLDSGRASRPAFRGGRLMDSQPSKTKRIPDELARYLNELRMRVHRYRRYGLLPEGRGTLRLRARRGSGLTCLVCGEPVLASEPEIGRAHV